TSPSAPVSRSPVGPSSPSNGCVPCCSTQKPMVYVAPGFRSPGTGSRYVTAHPPDEPAGGAPAISAAAAARMTINLLMSHLHPPDSTRPSPVPVREAPLARRGDPPVTADVDSAEDARARPSGPSGPVRAPSLRPQPEAAAILPVARGRNRGRIPVPP